MAKFEYINSFDENKIRVAIYEPSSKPTGIIQIVHGFGEGIGHYDEVADFFTKHGLTCIMHDQRGFGLMEDKTPKEKEYARGVVPAYDYFLKDINVLKKQIKKWYGNLPIYLFGHSMGGNIVANYLMEYPQDEYKKAILEAPWLRLYEPFPVFLRNLAKFIGNISGNIAIKSNLKKEYITRNKDRTTIMNSDGIFHTRMSIKLFHEISEAGEHVIENAEKIKIPSLLLCPGEEKIVCPKAIREFSTKTGDNFKYIEYPGGYHCLHSDIISEEVLNDILNFILN